MFFLLSSVQRIAESISKDFSRRFFAHFTLAKLSDSQNLNTLFNEPRTKKPISFFPIWQECKVGLLQDNCTIYHPQIKIDQRSKSHEPRKKKRNC